MPSPTSTPPDAPELDGLLCFAVHSAGFAFARLYRRALRRLGLTYPQYLVLVALWAEDGVAVGHLGGRLSLETSTLTPLLKRLEALGFLTRRRSDTDERRVMIALTEAGRVLRQDAAEVTRCIVEGAGMPAADFSRLTREIHALRAKLERAAATAPV